MPDLSYSNILCLLHFYFVFLVVKINKISFYLEIFTVRSNVGGAGFDYTGAMLIRSVRAACRN